MQKIKKWKIEINIHQQHANSRSCQQFEKCIPMEIANFSMEIHSSERCATKGELFDFTLDFSDINILRGEREKKLKAAQHWKIRTLEHGELQRYAHSGLRMCSKYVRHKVLVHWPLCFFFCSFLRSLVRCVRCNNRLTRIIIYPIIWW